MAYDPELADRLREALQGESGLTEQAMFGGLAFLLHGHLAVAASRQGGLLLRVDPAHTESLLARAHAEAFVMRGRAVAGWLHITESGIESDVDLRRWVRLGADYAGGLAPK